MSSIWDKPVSHGDILNRIWRHLGAAVKNRKHPFHLAVFGTAVKDEANLRTVTLRRFWKKPRGLAFHAHSGSPKIAQIEKNPKISWLFYHPEEKFQVRVGGVASVHSDDELADEQWQKTAVFSRRCYMGAAPTTTSKKPTHGMPEGIADRDPAPKESESGRINFVVVRSTIESIDCVELDVRGHRRSLFVWNQEGELQRKWLTP